MVRVVAFALLVGLSLLRAGAAGEYNPVLDVGDKAPDWRDLPGTDGKRHSLADFKDHDVVVLFFMANSCDVAAAYEDRILAIAKKYGGRKCAFVAVNVNKIPEDSLDEMKKRADERQYPFPYLFDASQKIAKDYGATSTPEFFVLDRDRNVVYMGGIDDSSTPATVKNKYLEAALDAVLAGGKPKIGETVAIGCGIRYERERRRRK